ncbi:MAG: hypothetical protein K2W96_25205 [Gemmataceae bacterium]|nr:hypothetical protein [Gemmataceae bacterium]
MLADSTRAAMAAEDGEGAAATEAVPARKRKGKKRGKKKGMSQRRAVHLVVDDLGAAATSGQVREEVKKRYGLDIEPNIASQYRSTYLKKLREGGARASDAAVAETRRVGRPPKAAEAATGSEPTFDEVLAVKALYERIGEKRFGEVLALIGAR